MTYITTVEAAAYLTDKGYSIKPASLNVARAKGRGPSFIRIGRGVRYRIEDLDRFLERKTKRISLES